MMNLHPRLLLFFSAAFTLSVSQAQDGRGEKTTAEELDNAFGLSGVAKTVELNSDQKGTIIETLAKRTRESLVVVSQMGRDGGVAGTGTGFIISEDGLIATCTHVVGEARPVKIELADGSLHDVTAIHAWDRKLDMTVLRIDTKGLKPLPLGDSDTLKQGAPVAAMGNPHGLDFSVVEGVVSAIREFEEKEDSVPLFQLAIPIEPGNSGSPLLDLNGNVQGMLNMKSTVTNNLGFAVPINNLKSLLEHPNTVPMKNWLTIGAINSRKWTPLMGATWRQRAGTIIVENPGDGFGGRSLCVYQMDPPPGTYEVAVDLKMDDESGAAGLIFASDGDERHYGFYPSSGQMRLTRFDGPDVFSWNVLAQFNCDAYRPGEWNSLRVRVEPEKIIGYVNGVKVIEDNDQNMRGGKIGLAKFRQTRAEFRRFRVGDTLDPPAIRPELADGLEKIIASHHEADVIKNGALAEFAGDPKAARLFLSQKKREMELAMQRLDDLDDAIHCRDVAEVIGRAFDREDKDVDIAAIALEIARLDNPDIDTAGYLEEIERMAVEISTRLPGDAAHTDKLKSLSTYLFEENGFHGSRDDYYNRSNSYINEVLDDREGIPVTLSLLYIELARRIGVEDVVGIGLPGHFVAQYRAGGNADDWQFIDVFERGKFITQEEASNIARAHGDDPEADALSFPPSTKREIITRVLTNLKTNAIDEEDYAGAVRYVDLSITLNPDNGGEHLSRALLYVQSGKREAAKLDLEWLFKNKPEGIHLERLRQLYDTL